MLPIYMLSVLRADYLALDNQLEGSSLGKATSLIPRLLRLFKVLYVRLMSYGLLSIQFGVVIVVIFVKLIYRKSC